MYHTGNPEVELNLTFRDYLRAHPDVRDAYAALKQQILSDKTAGLPGDGGSGLANYTLRKGAFIRDVLRRAGFQRVRMLRAADTDEWARVRSFRRAYFSGAEGAQDPHAGTFSDPQHQHFLLYRGVDVVGYAHVQLQDGNGATTHMVVIDPALSARSAQLTAEFSAWIGRWITERPKMAK